MLFFQKLFGSRSGNNKKCNAPQFRKLRVEPLESREMLAVGLGEIQAAYPDLNLSGNYNIIEIQASELSDTKIRAAIDQAGKTTGNDIIVCHTTETQNKITLGGTELAININASSYGSVTIVSLGDKPLTIDANLKSRAFYISESGTEVALAGLTIRNGKVDDFSSVNGGGIYNSGTLLVANSTITGNELSVSCQTSDVRHTPTARGGGIYNSGKLFVISSTITGNKVSSYVTRACLYYS